MLGKRSDRESTHPELRAPKTASSSKEEFVRKFMLEPEGISSKEHFVLKYYVDYEYPRSQGSLKAFWEDLVLNTLSDHYHSASGELIGSAPLASDYRPFMVSNV